MAEMKYLLYKNRFYHTKMRYKYVAYLSKIGTPNTTVSQQITGPLLRWRYNIKNLQLKLEKRRIQVFCTSASGDPSLHDKLKQKRTREREEIKGAAVPGDLNLDKEKERKIFKKTITENIWTIPNALCVMRICMAPVVAFMIVNSQFGPAIGIFAVAGVSDLLDGWIARVVPGQSSVMGSFLDPMADKILVGSLFLSLTYMDFIPLALTSLIIGRDAILISFGFYIRYRSLDPPKTISRYFNVAYPTAQLAPTFISKINTGVQLGLVGATLLSTVLPYDLHAYLEFLWYFTAATTIASAVGYCFAKDTVKLLRKQRDTTQS